MKVHTIVPGEIFVFGSNLQGKHAGGAARTALDHFGAVWGIASGHEGDSYAIPTKRNFEQSLDISDVRGFVYKFIDYAEANPHLKFFVTRVGCGLAGFTDEQISELFATAPDNCRLPPEWLAIYNTPHGQVQG